MPFPSDKSDSSTSGGKSPEPLDATVASLAKFLADDSGSQPSDQADQELATLFKYLESANTVASGVESRLDGLLANLDSMLSRLEPMTAETNADGSNEICQAEARGDNKGEEKKESFVKSDDSTKS